MEERLRIVFVVLALIALVALWLSLPYLFPPESIQECNKILRMVYGGYNYEYNNCVTFVAVAKGDNSLCAYVKNSYYKKDCMDFNYNEYYLDDLDCNDPYYEYDHHTCKAIELAEQGR